jgi:hypothetical protein
MRPDIDSVEHIPDVRGWWDLLKETNKNVTFRMNKGGMDEKEFEDMP